MSELDRRKFLRNAGSLSATALLASLMQPAWGQQAKKAIQRAGSVPPSSLASDEDFWYYIQQCYTVNPQIIELNNGGVSPQPRVVQEALERFNQEANEGPSYFMWRDMDRGREPLREKLAQAAGCSAEEIAINRNSTEALETVIFGLQLNRGDEVVLARQDYPNMINAWKQREMRDGIKLVWINLELPSEDNEYMARQFTRAFTAKTRVVHITHIINWNGQILPVRKIADAAHARNIEVLVDGAHSFAHFNFAIPDLGADYFGTSLHKWLSAPFGSGFLYVKKEKIPSVYPLFASGEPLSGDIRKFENLGTRSFPIEQAIGVAVDFHNMIGIERKQRRLHYLKNYWIEKLRDEPKVKVHTSLHPEFGGAIGMVSVEGKPAADLDAFLLEKYRIHTVGIKWENIHGLRVTPNVYTTTAQLDKLVRGIRDFSSKA